MSYNNEFSSSERRGDNTYGSNLDTTRDNTTGTGNFDRGFDGRERRDNDHGVSGGEFGRSDNFGGTGGLGGHDHSDRERGAEFGRSDGEYGGVRTQDRFDNTGATGAGGYGSSAMGTGTGTGMDDRDRSDNTFGTHERREHDSNTMGEFNRGNESYGERTDASHGMSGAHKPTMGEKMKGTMEAVTGKVTRNTAKVEHGRELKSGEIDNNNNNDMERNY